MNITQPRITLRLEGFTFLVAAIIGYARLDFAWWPFFVGFFLPDVAIGFYVFGTKLGSVAYNFAHTYSLAVAVLATGMMLTQPVLIAVGLIWLGHIGMDRMVGYGLKYATHFKDTHLGHV